MVMPYIGAYLKIAKYAMPGSSIRYSQGERRMPRSSPRLRRGTWTALSTSSSSARGTGAAGVLIEVIDPSFSRARAQPGLRRGTCRGSVRFLSQFVHLIDHLLAAAGLPALQFGGQPVLVELTGQELQPGVDDDLIEDRPAVQIGLGDVGRSRVEHGMLRVGLMKVLTLLGQRLLRLALRFRGVGGVAV